MSVGPLNKSLEPVRQLAAAQFFADWEDRQLLERFLSERDQAAFAELVQRQRRLVWSVCRRLLGHDHDADDAFQATFLVLAMKGRSIRKRQALSSWLYGVAYRCAMQIKRRDARRRSNERRTSRAAAIDPAAEINVRELWTLLEHEIQRLPEKHRMPFVLCCLEGKSHEEAGRALGWTAGTVSGRLARARLELQKRLARRGVELSAALAAASLGNTDVSAAVVAATVRGAMAVISGAAVLAGAVSPNVCVLVKGVSQAMLFSKLKTATVILVLVGLMAGAGLTAQQAVFRGRAGGNQAEATDEPKDLVKPAAAAERNEDLRYDGKPFEYWRDYATNELKAERRIEAVRAMGAFGVRGYAKEGTTVILKLMKEYRGSENAGFWGWTELMRGSKFNGTPDQQVVLEACIALSKIGLSAVPLLLKNLEDGNGRDFASGVFTFHIVPLPESAVPTLLRLVRAGKKEIRHVAVVILREGWQVDEESLWPAVVDAINKEKDVGKLVGALSEIVATPRLAGDQDAAARILGHLGARARQAGGALVKAALARSANQNKEDNIPLKAVLLINPDPQVVVPLASEGLKPVPRGVGQQDTAIAILKSLGPNAKAAVPALLGALSELRVVPGSPLPFGNSVNPNEIGANQLAIIDALEKIRPDKDQIVPALAKILADTTEDPRLSNDALQNKAFELLRKIETQFEPIVPALAVFLDRKVGHWFAQWGKRVQPEMRPGPGSMPRRTAQRQAPAEVRQVLEIFEKLGPKAHKAMPVLLKTFKVFDDVSQIQGAVISTWTRMGSAAREALPSLYQFLASTEEDPDLSEDTRQLREAATAAIKAMSK
jgi:RNA polymerase sigma factor (sigma-70 family)